LALSFDVDAQLDGTFNAMRATATQLAAGKRNIGRSQSNPSERRTLKQLLGVAQTRWERCARVRARRIAFTRAQRVAAGVDARRAGSALRLARDATRNYTDLSQNPALHACWSSQIAEQRNRTPSGNLSPAASIAVPHVVRGRSC